MSNAESATAPAGAQPPATSAPPGTAPVMTVSQLHDALDEALRSAGLRQVWVTGVVQSLRRKPRYCSFELVEYHSDANG